MGQSQLVQKGNFAPHTPPWGRDKLARQEKKKRRKKKREREKGGVKVFKKKKEGETPKPEENSQS